MSAETEIRALLPRLDQLIEREILRLRGRYQLSLDEFRGLYISDAQVDALLVEAGIPPVENDPPPPLAGGNRWQNLAARFDLCPLDQDLLLLAIAGEIDTKYPTLFAYLQDDVSRRLPTLDLALRLFGTNGDMRALVRQRLSLGAPLRRTGLVRLDDAAGLLLSPLHASPPVVRHLLGGDALEELAIPIVPPPATPRRDCADLPDLLTMSPRPLVVLAGRQGNGQEAFAAQTAAMLGMRLARIPPDDMLPPALHAAQVEGAAVLVHGPEQADALLVDSLAEAGCPAFLAIHDLAGWQPMLARQPYLLRSFAIAPIPERRDAWQAALRAANMHAAPAALEAVATRFRLSRDAIGRAAHDVRLHALPINSRVRAGAAQLFDAARRQCAIDLGHLATRIDHHPGWSELVLPASVQGQLRDLAGAAAQRDHVYGEWGMGGVGRGVGGGICALFTGASGTGKTMSAAVIAGETGLDLWRIDLSSVVSKYIGETEKNLDRIFRAAREGDAILFCDEADALFGKRSEVKDAHDRYANIETAYLLQRIEEHDGIVILASNLARNIDQAFLRRLNYVIEFPLPDAKLRERLWRGAFGADAPVDQMIDAAALGRKFPLSGGDIRSAALDAAFLAASNGGRIDMDCILRAVSRQMLKQGKLPNQSDFNGHSPTIEARL